MRTLLLTLRAIWAWIKSHKSTVIVAVVSLILLSVAGYYLIKWRAQSQDYVRQLRSYQAVVEIHEGAYLQQTAKLDLAETLIREYSPQPATDLGYHAEVKIVYKTRRVEVPVVNNVIEYRDKYITITGTSSGGCTVPDGGSLPDTSQPQTLTLDYTLTPLQISLFITRNSAGDYQTIVDVHDAGLKVDVVTKLDPAVFQDQKHWFAGAGLLTRIRDFSETPYSVGDIGGMVQAGYLGGRWYVSVQAQYLDGFGVGLSAGGRF
jgi:hypothetical protein